jgi:hypothetical protein
MVTKHKISGGSSKVKKLIVSLLLALALVMTFALPVFGASGSFGYTDWATNDTINDVSYFGQSFTPTESMYVTSARLWIISAGWDGSQPRIVNVAIRENANGANLGVSSDTGVPPNPDWWIDHNYFDFGFSTPVHLTAGTTYYLVINSTSGTLSYRYCAWTDNKYVNGQRLSWNGSTGYEQESGDLMFQVFYYTNSPPDVTNAAPSVETIWSPNNKFVDVNILGVTDPDGDPVAITISSITSDEPTGTIAGAGGPIHAPDATIGTGGSFRLRAERSGLGDGRVYMISFTANDGQGGVTPGSVVVTVPHHQTSIAVDSRGVDGVPGAGYDATVFN